MEKAFECQKEASEPNSSKDDQWEPYNPATNTPTSLPTFPSPGATGVGLPMS
jgi:hypothetical protein